ncbi:MAG: hypothetical protein ACP5KN_14835, partial [Armatimonadota bacterium]
KGAVTGMVTSSGAAAPGATLVSGNAHATAKPDGSYALYNMEAGERGITAVSADGTTTGWAMVDVEDGETTTGVNIALTLSPPPPPLLQ